MLSSWVLAVFCVCLVFLFIWIQKPKNFPPGPWPIPIFGNLFQLDINNPLKDLERLAKCYGKVYSLYFGRRPAVVLTGLKAIKEALVTKSADFSGRPDNLLVSNVMEKKGVIMADYGPGWKEHRRFDIMTLRNFGMGKQSMENRILAEIKHMVARLEKSVGSTMNPQTLFHDAASNIIFLVLISTRYEYEDQSLKEYIRLFTELSKIANGPWGMIYDTLPFLRYLPLPFKKAFTYSQTLKQKAANMINQHKETRVPGQPRDFVDCYLDELDMKNEGSSFSEMQLVMHLLDLHYAGTDTTSNTLLTAFLYLITHPDIQEKCQQEIDEVLEGKDHASFEDRHNMPYTQAVIHESQRIANTVPLSVFHSTTRDTELMGYRIPAGTLIIPNLSSLLSEEGQWKFPHEFNPSNFLSEQGQFEKPEAFMPFSAGPRTCLGEGLARMELFLVMVTLLRRFQFTWPEDAGAPNFTPVYGITLTPKPYKMGVKLRHPTEEKHN
ncbi:cytochrome P450, family 2, subfamily X, polypeptide 9 [Silurus asotus]|uniref:Cytochrome P450, family 2, subfamily X, polypeptide 9 n=1 Tax=Silurus asotus TaxID=30991 RepID=A0AAD5A245_SILAS|nr:cytochrome P450, family 2, subfamily X, polypeptide 9 [Silurus asotus]